MHTKILLWSTWLVILAVYIGFAGVWGTLARQPYRFRTLISVGFGLVIILPASLALPYTLPGKLLAWGIALMVAGVFYLEPAKFPAWFWKRHFILYYFGLLMFLILAWTAWAGDSLAWLWLGLPAGVAGWLAIFKACRYTHQRGAV